MFKKEEGGWVFCTFAKVFGFFSLPRATFIFSPTSEGEDTTFRSFLTFPPLFSPRHWPIIQSSQGILAINVHRIRELGFTEYERSNYHNSRKLSFPWNLPIIQSSQGLLSRKVYSILYKTLDLNFADIDLPLNLLWVSWKQECTYILLEQRKPNIYFGQLI